MEQINQIASDYTKLGLIGMTAFALVALGMAFICVCAGIAILRISKQKKPPQVESPKQVQSK